MSIRHRQHYIHYVTHITTGHYFANITTTREVNLEALCKRVNDSAALSGTRLVVNHPLKDFSDQHSPSVPKDWTFEIGTQAFDSHDDALVVALEEIHTNRGELLLLTGGLIHRGDWKAVAPAKEAIIKRRALAKKATQIDLASPLASLLWFSEQRYSNIETTPVESRKSLNGSLLIWSTSEQFTLLTPDTEVVANACTASGKLVMLSITVDLVFKDKRRFQSGNVVRKVKFGHFAPSFLQGISELMVYVTEMLAKHTGDSDYTAYSIGYK